MPRRNKKRHPSIGRNRSTRARGAPSAVTKRRDTGPVRIVCPTGKSGFVTEVEALAKLAQIRAERVARHAGTPCRVYQCDRCSGWHLTAQPFKRWVPARSTLHATRYG